VHRVPASHVVVPHSATGQGSSGGFAAALHSRLQLPVAIAGAAADGTLELDAAQRDYLSALLGQPLPEAGAAADSHTAGSSGGHEEKSQCQRF
jgi:hypothetical protein